MALANDPALLVCDEPTTALDVTVQALVLDLIVRGVAARDAALLFITHDLAVVATVCQRVLVMYGGRVVEAGPVAEVFTRPRHRYTQGLLGGLRPRRRRRARPAGHHRRLACPAPAGSPPGACSATAARTPPRPASRSRRGRGPDAASGFACHHPAVTGPGSRPAPPDGRVGRGPRGGAPWLTSRSRSASATSPATTPARAPRCTRPGPVVHALRGVSFDVAPGERFGIVGESGCGKSTLLRILRRARPAHLRQRPGRRHRHRRAARAPAAVPARAAAAGLPGPDELARPPDAGARHHRRTAGGAGRTRRTASGWPSCSRRSACPPTAAGRYPHQFSGGQRQRISIARALAPRPRRAGRRRAGQRAGRLGPRPGPQRAHRPGRRSSSSPWCSSRTTCRWSGASATGWR